MSVLLLGRSACSSEPTANRLAAGKRYSQYSRLPQRDRFPEVLRVWNAHSRQPLRDTVIRGSIVAKRIPSMSKDAPTARERFSFRGGRTHSRLAGVPVRGSACPFFRSRQGDKPFRIGGTVGAMGVSSSGSSMARSRFGGSAEAAPQPAVADGKKQRPPTGPVPKKTRRSAGPFSAAATENIVVHWACRWQASAGSPGSAGEWRGSTVCCRPAKSESMIKLEMQKFLSD